MSRSLSFICFTVLLLILGCGEEGQKKQSKENKQEEPVKYLEDYLDPSKPTEYIAQHASLYVNFQLKPGVSKETVSSEIIKYLTKKESTRSTKIETQFKNDEYPLTPRQIWALILADLNEINLEIRILGDIEERERNILQLLEKIRNKDKRLKEYKQEELVKYLEDYLNLKTGIGFDDESSTYDVDVWLKYGVPKEVVTSEIIKYLEKKEGACSTNIGSQLSQVFQYRTLDQQLRPREFWALILADLNDMELEIRVMDNIEERERNISGLLEKLKSKN